MVVKNVALTENWVGMSKRKKKTPKREKIRGP